MTTTQEFTRLLRMQYTRLTFTQFCAIIGESPFIGDSPNSYALEKFNTFHSLCNNVAKLGTFLDKVIENAHTS